MIKIKKGYSFRIVWVLLTVLFSNSDIVYSNPSLDTLLRIPVGQKSTMARLGKSSSLFYPETDRDNTQCQICGSKNNRMLFSYDNHPIVQCSSCGLVWKKWHMSFEDQTKFYERYYRGQNGNAEHSLYASGNLFRTYEAERRLDRIGKLSKVTSLLDIGCGPGYFLEVASDRGIKCQGIDVSSPAIEYARARGLNVKQGDFLELDYDENFDVVTLWASIEHLDNPRAYLLKAHSLLKPDGLIVIETGDINSTQAKVFGRKWRIFTPDHNYFFSSETLDILLEKVGFKTIKTEYDGFLEGIIDQFVLTEVVLEQFKRQREEMQVSSSAIKESFNYLAGKFNLGDVMIKYAVKKANIDQLQINPDKRKTIFTSI